MKLLLAVFLTLILFGEAHATSLWWDSPLTGDINIEWSQAEIGPFERLATVPASSAKYLLTPGQFGYYRITSFATVSNVVRYTADLYGDSVTTRLDSLEARVTALETEPVPDPGPMPTDNLSSRMIDADHIEITGLNCASLKTTGSGLKRVVECVH